MTAAARTLLANALREATRFSRGYGTTLDADPAESVDLLGALEVGLAMARLPDRFLIDREGRNYWHVVIPGEPTPDYDVTAGHEGEGDTLPAAIAVALGETGESDMGDAGVDPLGHRPMTATPPDDLAALLARVERAERYRDRYGYFPQWAFDLRLLFDAFAAAEERARQERGLADRLAESLGSLWVCSCGANRSIQDHAPDCPVDAALIAYRAAREAASEGGER